MCWICCVPICKDPTSSDSPIPSRYFCSFLHIFPLSHLLNLFPVPCHYHKQDMRYQFPSYIGCYYLFIYYLYFLIFLYIHISYCLSSHLAPSVRRRCHISTAWMQSRILSQNSRFVVI